MSRVYCVSDLHGELGLFKQIQEYLKEGDICYVLGDCLDRGECGIEIIFEIMKDSRFIMLLGNHEKMFLEIVSDYKQGYTGELYRYFLSGGRPTWDSYLQLSEKDAETLVYFLHSLPLRIEYKDKIMTHAGFHDGVSIECEETYLWDRSHLDISSPMRDKWIIHGHTPTRLIQEECFGILHYHEKKICVDCGATFLKRTGILDLDSLEQIYFEEPK